MEIKLSNSDKIELALWLANHNGGVITGSIALRLKGIDLGRDIGDIDILVENDTELELPPFTTEYIGGVPSYECEKYMFCDTIIDFISKGRIDQEIISNYTTENLNTLKYLPIALIEDILEAKKSYLNGDRDEMYLLKTKHDIAEINEWIRNRKMRKDYLDSSPKSASSVIPDDITEL